MEAQADSLPVDIRFRNVDELFTFINRTANDFAVLHDVSPENFKEIKEAREARGRRFRLSLYKSKEQILWITIPTGTHEGLHFALGMLIYEACVKMGLAREWHQTGSRTFPAENEADSSGEGDSGGKPLSKRPQADAWPTLAIEAGYSQSMTSLRTKAKWWFDNSNHEVKIVILVKLHRAQKVIELEKWTETVRGARDGVRTRAQARVESQATPEPTCVQSISIRQRLGTAVEEWGNLASYTVTRGALVLEFHLLFLRQPVGRERDVIISTATLRDFASIIWLGMAG